MAIYLYEVHTGRLVSWSPEDDDPVASDDVLAARGLAKATGMQALDGSNAWDEGMRTVAPAPAPRIVRPVGTPKWILRFTGQEMVAIKASTNVDVQHILYALGFSYELDMNDGDVINGVNLLVSLGLLDASRVAAILA